MPGDLTQTSHLIQLAKVELDKEFQHLSKIPPIISLRGIVTAEVRAGWNLWGCLLADPFTKQEYLRRESETKENGDSPSPKKIMRGVSHLHHALDACVLGYISHFMPNEGEIWKLLFKRRSSAEDDVLVQKGLFFRDVEGRAYLKPLGDDRKNQIIKCLKECRVVQHVPKKMDGLVGLKENTHGIVAIEMPDADRKARSKEPKLKMVWNKQGGEALPLLGNMNGAIVHLEQYGPRDPKNGNKRERESLKQSGLKLLGLNPDNGNGKLRAIKGVRIISENFGLALWRRDGQSEGEQQFRIIVWHKVWPQLKAIAAKENGGKWPDVLRNGQIIHVPTAKGQSDYRGYWQILSIKNNKSGLAFNMIRPDMVKERDGVDWAGINVSATTLIKCGMTVVKSGLTGVPLNL